MITQVVEVRFKGNRKSYFDHAGPEPLRTDEPVIVQAERGQDLGRVGAVGEAALAKCGPSCGSCDRAPSAPAEGARMQVLRRATPEDLERHRELRRGEEDVRRTVIERTRAHDLLMKISDTEWQWDGAKLTVYFTADQRVDFRTLVRDLATRFRTRIELRQIGVRDEAARLSGVGRCGREYCCSSWLTELSPVSLSLAKDQSLSLNPSQISGGCGRLLCCLKYEHEFYVTARKRFPRVGRSINTLQGSERVVAVDIFRERVLLRGEAGQRSVLLADLREETEQAVASAPPAAPAVPADSADSAVPADSAAPTDPATPRRKRRRRRRGGGGGSGGSSGGPARG